MAIKTETRSVRDFSTVELRGYGDIHIEQVDPDSSLPESLVIEADEDILPRLKSEVRGGRLVLGFDLAWWEWFTWWMSLLLIPNKSIRYRITMRKVDGLSLNGASTLSAGDLRASRLNLGVSGSGKIRIDQLQAQELRTNISGSGELDLAGRSQRQEIHISGAGTMRAGGLETQETSVSISGSGRVLVNAAQDLRVSISGSGEVEYRGSPKVSQHISGSGRVRQA